MKRHWELDVEIPTDTTRAPPSPGVPTLVWSSSRPASDPTRWPSHPPKSTLGQGRRWLLPSHSSKVTSSVHLSSAPFLSALPPSRYPWQLQPTPWSLLCRRPPPARHHHPAIFQPHTHLHSLPNAFAPTLSQRRSPAGWPQAREGVEQATVELSPAHPQPQGPGGSSDPLHPQPQQLHWPHRWGR